MNFTDVASGDSVFLDANVFIYDFAPDPVFGPSSKALLKRIESGDALLLATMQIHGLTLLASNDADFDRIPGITRFGPV